MKDSFRVIKSWTLDAQIRAEMLFDELCDFGVMEKTADPMTSEIVYVPINDYIPGETITIVK